MRTSLNIDDPVLARVRRLAHQRGETLGAVVSDLLVKALDLEEAHARPVRNGVPLYPAHASATADLELVNRLRDEDP